MPWLTPEKLAAIGFVCPALAANETVKSCGLSRRAYLALEYEGDAWQKTLAEYRRRRDEIGTQPRVGPPPSMVAFYEEQIQFGSLSPRRTALTGCLPLARETLAP